jgi:hypothetical protein
MSSIIKIAVIFACLGKIFTDLNTLFMAQLCTTVIVSVVEGGIPNGGYREILAITIYGFDGTSLPAAMIRDLR